MYRVEYDDSDLFGPMSFLDILEEKKVPFIYDGKFLELPTRTGELEARRLWTQLTRCSMFGRRIEHNPDL